MQILVFMLISMTGLGQMSSNIRVIPNAGFGYTFGKGINFTVGCGASLLDYKMGKQNAYAGVDLSLTFFTHEKQLYKQNLYKTVAINLMNVVNEMFILKLGMVKSKLKWGVNNVNASYSKTWKPNIDLAFKPFAYSPQLGFRLYSLGNSCMGIGTAHPTFLYIGYQYPILVYSDAGKPQSAE